MLAKTLRRAGGGHGHGHGSSVPSTVAIDRTAPYFNHSKIVGFHAHHEPNFRKAPVGWAGWNSPKYQDPFAPYMQQTPVRHVEKGAMFGMWFGMGHFALKNFFGPLHWKFWARTGGIGFCGWSAALFFYSVRMSKNGWQWKNRGAVFGME